MDGAGLGWRMSTIERILIIACGLTAMTAIGLDLWSRSHPGGLYAQAIAKGYSRTIYAADREAAEDEAITNGANEAGYRWAEQQGLTDSKACPARPDAFRDGCLDWTAEQSAP